MLSAHKAAELRGDRFYEGRPCKLGHTLRSIKNRHCIRCDRERKAKKRRLVSNRQIAMSLGKQFYIGTPCEHGHVKRYTTGGHCVKCNTVKHVYISPRKLARLRGDKHYEGRPCKFGHTLRLVSSCGCVQCCRDNDDPEYRRAYEKWWYATHDPDRIRRHQWGKRYRERHANEIVHRRAVRQNTYNAIMGTLI